MTTISPLLFSDVPHKVKECSDITFNASECYYPSVADIPSGMAVCSRLNFVSFIHYLDVCLVLPCITMYPHHITFFNPKDGISCISEEYFEPFINDPNSTGINTESVLCDGITGILQNQNGTIWSLIFKFKDTDDFAKDVVEVVVENIMCRGINQFHKNMWAIVSRSLDFRALTSCRISKQVDFTCVGGLSSTVSMSEFFDSMNFSLSSYEVLFKRKLIDTLDCIESNTANNTLINEVFTTATNSLQSVLEEATTAAWIAMFDGMTVEDALGEGDKVLIEMLNRLGISIESDLFNIEELVASIAVPSLDPSTSYATMVDSATTLVDSVFHRLKNTMYDANTAYETALRVLPSNIKVPDLKVDDLCQTIYSSRDNVTLYVDTVGSTSDHYCRAHLTACTTSGMCLLGIGSVQTAGFRQRLPYQFFGQKCREDPNLQQIIEVKERLGGFQTYTPNVFL